MTAILGYASAGTDGRPGESLLLADDLEGGSKARVDKVILLGNRFAMAVAGNSALEHCASYLDAFCRPGHQAEINTVEEIASNLQQLAATFIPWLHESYREAVNTRRLTKEKLLLLEAQHDSCVVLDCLKHELWFIGCGQLFSAKGPPATFVAERLEDKTTYGFAQLFDSGRPRNYGSGEGLPWNLMKQQIRAAHKLSPHTVGDLGAYVECSGGQINLRSCFKAPQDHLRSAMDRGFLGFSINVLCPNPH